MTTSRTPWTVNDISKMLRIEATYPDNHLLGLPVELKTRIYDHILADIQNVPRIWNQKPGTEYDSLLLVCKQLHLETSQHVFLYRATKVGLPKILGLLPNKTNVGMLRALDLQVSYQADHQTVQCIAAVLDKFQLTVQELRLSFYGQDLHGNNIEMNGCGCNSFSYQNNQQEDLLLSGQDIDSAFALLRQITNLRNLRILHIENLNLPVLRYVLFSNKQHLQAIRLVTDSRVQVCDFKKLFQRRRDLFRGMLGGILTRPFVRVLELDANAVVPAELIFNTLSSDLNHFSWRVPNYDHQSEPETTISSFEYITSRIIQMLSIRAPDLKTCRLCVTRRAPNPERPRLSWETSAVSQALARYLPTYVSLKHLEIHDSFADRFYPDELVASLPYGLERLYISERLINVDTLAKRVQERYIRSQSVEDFSDFDILHDMLDERQKEHRSIDDIVYMSVNPRGHLRFHTTDKVEGIADNELLVERSFSATDDFLADNTMLGESRAREDSILLKTGKLGFVMFEYDVSTDKHQAVVRGYRESVRTKIFKLNGQLLDREHNMHLASNQKPKLSSISEVKPESPILSDQLLCKIETDKFSLHPEINQALHAMVQLKWHHQHVTEVTADLEKCFDESMDWYFGAEDEAENVFHAELAAPVHRQKQKSTVVEVEENPTRRCRWWAPEYVVPPVGRFPAPVVPRGWRDDIEKGLREEHSKELN